jgi:hypothetical protein
VQPVIAGDGSYQLRLRSQVSDVYGTPRSTLGISWQIVAETTADGSVPLEQSQVSDNRTISVPDNIMTVQMPFTNNLPNASIWYRYVVVLVSNE